MRNAGKSFEQGLVYSIDGNSPTSQYITINKLNLISDNWYYYIGG